MNELYHHGIKGMHWGVRNGPPYPLSVKAHSKSEVSAGWRSSLYKNSSSDDIQKNKNTYNTGRARSRAKGSEEGHNRINNNSSDKNIDKFTHRQKLEAKYRALGMSADDAKVAAQKRINAERIFAITLGVTVTAAAAYVAYKHYDYSVDKIIKSGKLLQRMEGNGDKAVFDAFYATANKVDNDRYYGMFGKLLSQRDPTSVYKKTLQSTEDIKIASDKTAHKLLRQLYRSDTSFAKDLENAIPKYANPLGRDNVKTVNSRAIKALKTGKVDNNVYEAFNRQLVRRNEPAVQKYYEWLRKNGYDGLRDINDRKYSGLRGRNPLIVINKGKVAVASVEHASVADILEKSSTESVKMAREMAIKDGLRAYAPYYGALSTGIAGLNLANIELKNQNVEKKKK